jgi:endonuclease/exonuclease/phosphatase family metal-dependent hydrolase
VDEVERRRRERDPRARGDRRARAAAAVRVANLHATAYHDARARRDVALARATALRWAAGAPLVLGGDLNLRDPELPGFVHAGPARGVDHVFARGLAVAAPAELLDRGGLSDHAPVRVSLA